MNTKRLIAVGLSAVWLISVDFGSHENAHAVGVVVANIWLAAALLAGGRE